MVKSQKNKVILRNKSLPRKPYLCWIEDPSTTITIRYATIHKKADTIFYGNGVELTESIDTNYGTEKEVTLRGLEPGTTYRYRIGPKGNTYDFCTAPNKNVPFSFVVYGDYASVGNKKTKLQLYQAIKKEHPAFLLFTGDLVSKGNNPYSWKNEFFGIIGSISPYVPLMPAPGNHDGKGPLFKKYFRYPISKRWYSFIYANAIFIALDTQSNYLPGSPQYEFLIKTLQESRAVWKFVYLHKPPYSTNRKHRSDLKVRKALCPIFEKYSVDIVFSGHNHCYERTQPILQNLVDLDNGVAYITTGGGGAWLMPFIARNKLSNAEKNWCKVRVKSYHYVLARIEDNKLVILAKNLSGKTIDGFTYVAKRTASTI